MESRPVETMVFEDSDILIANGQTSELQQKRKDLLAILTAAVHAVEPYTVVKRRFQNNKITINGETKDLTRFDNIYSIAFGKASIGMAQAVLDSITLTKGIAITNDPNAHIPDKVTEVVVGGHPLPNHGSIRGAEQIINLLQHTGANDLVIVLISGGGSALLCRPRVNLEELQETTRLLLRSGADINEINTIRKHLSFVKGGQLAQYAKCPIISLIISDIVHDPLEFISSGPTSPDSTTFMDAKKVLEKYHLLDTIPVNVRQVITDGIQGMIPETPKKDNPLFNRVHNIIVANNELACNAAVEKAKDIGYEAKLWSTCVTGESRTIGTMLIDTARSQSREGKKYVLIAGGETTVTIHGKGKGGRNQEMVLGCVETLTDTDTLFASFATDGVDGDSNAAGALADRSTLNRAIQLEMDPNQFLDDNNSNAFFARLADLLITGPTGTNVMDIQIVIT